MANYSVFIRDEIEEGSIDYADYAACWSSYKSAIDAINIARSLIKLNLNEEHLIIAYVMYEDNDESTDIYAISNKDKETTMKIRKQLQYVRAEVDEYADSFKNFKDGVIENSGHLELRVRFTNYHSEIISGNELINTPMPLRFVSVLVYGASGIEEYDTTPLTQIRNLHLIIESAKKWANKK